MKLSNVLKESYLVEGEQLVEAANDIQDFAFEMLEDIEAIRGAMETENLSEDAKTEINNIINEMYEELNHKDFDGVLEAVQRQFRRYGDTFKRQYRCTSGQKAGRMVTSPEKCGIRKDPRRVRIGKRASRSKKGQRVRKTLFTKRKSQSKRLSRLNKVMRGGE